MAGGVVNQPALLDMPRPQRRVRAAGGTDVTVGDGGTGVSSLTDGGVVVGSGSSAVTVLARLTNNQMMVGQTSGDPVNESGATLRTSIGAAGLADANAMTGANTHAGVETFSDDLLIGAISGIMETNSNFVDFAVFGPALDPVKDWHIPLGVSVATDLMLVTVEDVGANTDVTIWDLTDPTVVGATPLATVTLTGDATVTSVAAAMGYIIVGSEDGITIIDPHDGSWAERTVGWPKSLSTATTPSLINNDVVAVCVGFSDQPRHDPRTSGPMATFAVAYGTGADASSVLKDDGTVINTVLGADAATGCMIAGGYFFITRDGNTGDKRVLQVGPISTLTVDDTSLGGFTENDAAAAATPYTFGCTGPMDKKGMLAALTTTDGLSFVWGDRSHAVSLGCNITRAFNTGWMVGDIRGAWLANSKTADRSYKANTLTENGTVTEGAVETSAELKGYSGFSATNFLERASDADWNAIGTGTIVTMGWLKSTGPAANEQAWGFSNAGITLQFNIIIQIDGTIFGTADGATANVNVTSAAGFDDSKWHFVVFIQTSSTDRELWIDGIQVAANTTDSGSLTGTVPFRIGNRADDTLPAPTTTCALVRLTTTVPTAAQIRHMYETERRMFETSAKCLLQSASTDAVLGVNIDPITGKVGVTQTDDVVVFDGLIVVSEPAIPSGGTTREHYALYGGDSFEITDATLNAIIAAKDIRAEVERLRGERLPKGPDLSRAKAWIRWTGAGVSQSSFNIKSITNDATGINTVVFEVPFKVTPICIATSGQSDTSTIQDTVGISSETRFQATLRSRRSTSGTMSIIDQSGHAVFFGELENE